jgi:nucleotide-binding universal stress UspA family protein
MERILVPTDFSPTAEKALRYALQIATKSGGEVFLFHVYTPIESPFIETVEIRQEYNLENEKKLMKSLDELREKMLAEVELAKITIVLARSPLVGSFLKFTRDKDINLIVMGTHGASGLKKMLVGTLASRILEKTSVPLMLIPEGYEGSIPKKIVFTTHYQKEDIPALKFVGRLSRLFYSTITVVNIQNEAQENPEHTQEVFNQYIKDLKIATGESSLQCLLLKGPVSETLDHLQEKIPYDILVMEKRKKSFWERFFEENLTSHLAFLTKFPLLVIPSEIEN